VPVIRNRGRWFSLKFARHNVAFALLLFAIPLRQFGPWSALWTTPSILIASVLIAWGAESAQFFVAQGFALAILAWMQTLPEFAVEAVLAWKQQTELLMANLTGAVRLLTGLAWPMIYLTAALVHRKRARQPLRMIVLTAHQSVEVIGLLVPLLYALLIWWKGTLALYDAGFLVFFYAAYLVLLTRLPATSHEGIDDLEAVPKAVVTAAPLRRNIAIAALFLTGGGLIYFTAEPFLGSLIAVAAAAGIPTFLVIQWLAPVVSEFPELASTFYFARQEEKASIALMNIASSNINQWTLLVAMLPVVLSLGHGSVQSLVLDPEQKRELLLTIGQSFISFVFLLNMEFAWWEALMLFVLFAAQFALPAWCKQYITDAFFLWTVGEFVAIAVRRKRPLALKLFLDTLRRED
jgi:cation:H+ antiporter